MVNIFYLACMPEKNILVIKEVGFKISKKRLPKEYNNWLMNKHPNEVIC